MAVVKVYYDREGNTLTVWFGEPAAEAIAAGTIAEETGDEIILMKNQHGDVIGFEKLNFISPQQERVSIAFETSAL
jgi:uncharacterized protein YuzE